jgi:hypothetical protein
MTDLRFPPTRLKREAGLSAFVHKCCTRPVEFRGSELPLGHFFSVTPP